MKRPARVLMHARQLEPWFFILQWGSKRKGGEEKGKSSIQETQVQGKTCGQHETVRILGSAHTFPPDSWLSLDSGRNAEEGGGRGPVRWSII